MGKDGIQVAMLTIVVALRGDGQAVTAGVMTNYEDWDFWQQTAIRAVTQQMLQATQAKGVEEEQDA